MSIFDDHSHADRALLSVRRTEDPDTRMIHLDDGIDVLCQRQP